MLVARVELLPALSGYMSDRHCLLPIIVYRILGSDPSNVNEQMAYYFEGAMDAPDYLGGVEDLTSSHRAQSTPQHKHKDTTLTRSHERCLRQS